MKPTTIFLSLMFAILLLSASAFAGGNEPARHVSSETSQEKSGTNLQGQSSDFKDYLNEGDDEEKESNSIELADLGEDAKIAAGGDDSSVGLKVGY